MNCPLCTGHLTKTDRGTMESGPVARHLVTFVACDLCHYAEELHIHVAKKGFR